MEAGFSAARIAFTNVYKQLAPTFSRRNACAAAGQSGAEQGT